MFFLFDVTNRILLLGFMPESLSLLIFGIGLIVLAIGLRRLMKRSEKYANGGIEKMAEKANG
ncbi:MAG: hypothetical protein ABJA66_08280 [Actinomycetota bacterium]